MRAADLVGAYRPSSRDETQTVTLARESDTLTLAARDDESHDGELCLEEDEDRGVLYCDIGTESNVPSLADEAVRKSRVGAANEGP